jgi:hypothetical protein
MKKGMFFILICFISIPAWAQSSTESIISGGKAIIELISFLHQNKISLAGNLKERPPVADSCIVKQISDLCFRNSTSRDITISICKRNDTAYEPNVFSVKVLKKKKECLLELRSGIYKYRIEADEGNAKILFSEGEFRLQPCDNMLREIKE